MLDDIDVEGGHGVRGGREENQSRETDGGPGLGAKASIQHGLGTLKDDPWVLLNLSDSFNSLLL